ncbi:substrate-binding periplasmic protein [Psychromonas sp. KJ10-10]|uniref:substrate-binding periplasmic protein n=1 Tax=Psychromonas sp. KJ10-10 TaxID=3391823 RepID=UPI0039B4EEA1
MFQFKSILLMLITFLFTSLLFAKPLANLPTEDKKCLSMHIVFNASAGYLNETGKVVGFHVDFLNALERKTGFCMNKKLLPYARAKRSIELGGHDGGILASESDLDKSVIYIAKLLTSKTIIIPKKGLTLKNYNDLTKIVIGKVRGAKLDEAIDNDKNISFLEVSNYKHGLEMLKKGRIDAIAGNSLGLTVISELGMNDEVNLSGKYVLGQREVWFLLSNKSEYITKVEQLREATLALIEENIVDDILHKYFKFE